MGETKKQFFVLTCDYTAFSVQKLQKSSVFIGNGKVDTVQLEFCIDVMGGEWIEENIYYFRYEYFFMISFSGCGSALITESTPEQLYSDDHSIDMFVPYMKYVEG